MSRLEIVFLFSLFVQALSLDAGPLIVGGNTAPVGMYPYVVSLRLNNQHFCGGSIINPSWILTAAHCLKAVKSVADLKVVAGSNTITPIAPGGATYNVEKIISHSRFVQLPFVVANDVGLIKLKEKIVYTSNIKEIALCDSQPEGNSIATLVGWGLLESGGSGPPNNLQYLEYRTISWLSCFLRQFPAIVWCNFICAQASSTFGACNGDSGGPLVYANQQIGLVSWGAGKCASGKPDVYTNVCNFKKWIASNMNN